MKIECERKRWETPVLEKISIADTMVVCNPSGNTKQGGTELNPQNSCNEGPAS